MNLNKIMGVTAGALLLWSSQAFGYAEYNLYGQYYSNGTMKYYNASNSANAYVHYPETTSGTFTVPVLGSGDSYSWTFGYADAAHQKMAARAGATSTPANTNYTDADFTARASNQFTVSPGTSGLALGDTVNLKLNIKVDGVLSAASASQPDKGWANAQMSADLDIYDPSMQECLGGECWTPSLASFSADSRLQAYSTTWSGESYYSYWDESWSTKSNISPQDYHSDWAERSETGLGYYFPTDHYFDTGLLTLYFETVVGHSLDADFSLYTYASVNNDGYALADFGDTFYFDVLSDTPGLQIDWNVDQQPAAVPLPESGVLFGAGLLSLICRRRLNRQ